MPPKVARAVPPGAPSGSEIRAAAEAAISRLASVLEGRELLQADHFIRLKADAAEWSGWWWKDSKTSSLEEEFFCRGYQSVENGQRTAKEIAIIDYKSVEEGKRKAKKIAIKAHIAHKAPKVKKGQRMAKKIAIIAIKAQIIAHKVEKGQRKAKKIAIKAHKVGMRQRKAKSQ